MDGRAIENGYRIEPLTPEVFVELVPLMENAFGGNARLDLFQWKYLKNPAGPAIGHVARANDGKLAAFYGMIPERYRWGVKRALIYQSCDTMTHSDHRRRGLFKLLAEQTYANATESDPGFFAIGFSGPMSTPGFLKMNWKNPFTIPARFKPKHLLWFVPLQGKGPEPSDEISEHVVALMNQNAASRTNCKDYYPEFVAWRFSTPLVDYRYLVDVGAYAIYKHQGKNIFLLDFWEGEPGLGKGVMCSLQREATRAGMRGIVTICQSHGTLDRMLSHYIFLRNPFNWGPASYKTPFIIYGEPPAPEAVASSGWDITAIDFDSL